MPVRLLAIAALTLLASPAFAQEGTYTGSGEGDLTASIVQFDAENFGVTLDTVVPMQDDTPGCAGSVDGQAQLTSSGGLLQAENPDFDPDDPMSGSQFCEIQITLEDGTMQLEEQDGCLSFHGAACGFTGELTLQDSAD